MGRLLLIFILVPLVELALLVRLGMFIGFWPTIALVLVTGVVGAALARHEGLRVWLDIQRDLAEGRMPVSHLLDGLMILIGGVLLLTPGVLTDLMGILLLAPPTRRLFKRWLRRKLERMRTTGQVSFFTLIR